MAFIIKKIFPNFKSYAKFFKFVVTNFSIAHVPLKFIKSAKWFVLYGLEMIVHGFSS